MKRRVWCAFFSALAVLSAGTVSASADDTTAPAAVPAVTQAVPETMAAGTAPGTTAVTPGSAGGETSARSDTTEPESNGNKYYADDYYDTEGNATLIKEEQVIFDSEEMQFIAVTTKDGAVFYILINYSAADGEDNVYFLNKVDTLDLYSLLYASDEEDSGGVSAQDAEDKAQSILGSQTEADETASGTETETTTTPEPADETQPQKASGLGSTTWLLLIGILVLAAIGFFAFRKRGKKSGGKGSRGNNEDDMDDIFDDFPDAGADEGHADDEK